MILLTIGFAIILDADGGPVSLILPLSDDFFDPIRHSRVGFGPTPRFGATKVGHATKNQFEVCQLLFIEVDFGPVEQQRLIFANHSESVEDGGAGVLDFACIVNREVLTGVPAACFWGAK